MGIAATRSSTAPGAAGTRPPRTAGARRRASREGGNRPRLIFMRPPGTAGPFAVRRASEVQLGGQRRIAGKIARPRPGGDRLVEGDVVELRRPARAAGTGRRRSRERRHQGGACLRVEDVSGVGGSVFEAAKLSHQNALVARRQLMHIMSGPPLLKGVRFWRQQTRTRGVSPARAPNAVPVGVYNTNQKLHKTTAD